MIKKEMFGKIPMNLQMFADDGGAGEGNSGNDGGGSGSGSSEGTGSGSQHQGFDEFLKEPKNQAEFDRRVAKALETNRAKMQADIEAKIAEAKTEAEKLAKMNAEQKAKYEQELKEKELANREAEITKRELSAEAKETLISKGLPIQLAEILNYNDAKTCQASIEAVEKSFTEAVQKAVDEKLKGGAPAKRAPEGGVVKFTAEQIKNMTPEEINKNWDAVSASLEG